MLLSVLFSVQCVADIFVSFLAVFPHLWVSCPFLDDHKVTVLYNPLRLVSMASPEWSMTSWVCYGNAAFVDGDHEFILGNRDAYVSIYFFSSELPHVAYLVYRLSLLYVS